MQGPGRYTIQEEIASGSTATVYLAEDAVLHRKVALKKLHPHLLNHEETVKRFEQEAVAVARISHENIIRVYDYGNQDRNLYLAMEYVDGSTLEALLAAFGGPLPARVCHALFHQLMLGLSAAHAQGIVHRDIKPSNLLVDRAGRVRIADFGIAFLAEEKNITRTGAFLGTPVYSAPEQARCQPSSTKSDIFSSGILFYRCLSGRLPFDGESPHAILAAILEKAPVNPVFANPRILPGFSELTLAMLAKDPGLRPTAADCLRELEDLACRHGMPIEPSRIRSFVADPRKYAEEEGRELALHFLEQARAAEKEGRTRSAVKLAAQAELHGPVPPQAEPDIRRIAAAGKSLARRRAMAVGALVTAALGAAGLALRSPAVESVAELRSPSSALPASARPRVRETLPEVGPPTPAARPSESAGTAPARLAVGESPRPPATVPGEGRPLRKAVPPRPSAAPPAPREEAAKESAPVGVGFLILKTNPPFAKVSLDGKELGVTPFASPLALPEGEHEIRIDREGCLSSTLSVRIEPGRTSTLRVALDKAEAAAR